MSSFDRLFEVMDALLGPEGCPWDREQTVSSLRNTVLEETCELIEAIDLGDSEHIAEELGDLAFNVVFFCRLGEKEGLFTTEQVLDGVAGKLVRRHPHVFGDSDCSDAESVVEQWEAIKAEEKSGERESELDGLPIELPALLRAYKVVKRLKKAELPKFQPSDQEEEYGARLLALVQEARESGIEPETALRRVLAKREAAFREWESAVANRG